MQTLQKVKKSTDHSSINFDSPSIFPQPDCATVNLKVNQNCADCKTSFLFWLKISSSWVLVRALPCLDRVPLELGTDAESN